MKPSEDRTLKAWQGELESPVHEREGERGSAGAAKSISEILLELEAEAKVKALDRGQWLELQAVGNREKGVNTSREGGSLGTVLLSATLGLIYSLNKAHLPMYWLNNTASV